MKRLFARFGPPIQLSPRDRDPRLKGLIYRNVVRDLYEEIRSVIDQMNELLPSLLERSAGPDAVLPAPETSKERLRGFH
jgi:hypothetical protein